jgi:p21-activated kinase 1
MFKNIFKKQEKIDHVIGRPTGVVRSIHVYVDPETKQIMGLPKEWSDLLNAQVNKEEQSKNPTAAYQAITFFKDEMLAKEKQPDFKHTIESEPTPDIPERKAIAKNNQKATPTNNYTNVSLRVKLKNVSSDQEVYAEMKKTCNSTNPHNRLFNRREVGKGASGIVFIATDRERNEEVAIKTINLEAQACKKSILNELFVMKGLHHRNLINFLDAFFFESEKSLWIVMEYMDGGALTDVVTITEMKEKQIAAICYEVLLGLNFLHDKDIIHRDIKSGIKSYF